MRVTNAQAGSVLVRRNQKVTGGEEGLSLNTAQVPDWLVGVINTRNLYWVALAIVVVVYLIVLWVDRSRLGHLAAATRENELRVRVLGLRPVYARLIVFVAAAVCATMAGAGYLLLQSGTNPRAVSADLTITVLVMVVLGGVGFRWGAVVGGFLFTILDQRLKVLARAEELHALPDFLRIPLTEPLFLLGVLFILVVMFMPGGIAGTVDSWRRKRRGNAHLEASLEQLDSADLADAGQDGSGRAMIPGVQENEDGPHTIGRWLRERAGSDPRRVAIDDRGVALDYGTLYARADRFAQKLSDAGYGAGQRIATVSGNSSDQVVAFFACALLGIALVPLSWRLTPGELADLIARSHCALVLVDDEYSALAAAAMHTLGGRAPASAVLGETGAERTVVTCAEPCERRAARDEDPLLVIFTSGSEAAPKGVVLTHANCFWNNLALSRAIPLTADDVVLAILPQYHVAGWNIQPLLAWWMGATVVLERSFQPGRVLQLIQDRRVTAMMGVPTQYRMLHDAPEWATTDLSSLRVALVGGATIPEELAAEWAPRGIRLTQGYGLTEAGPNVLCLPAAELEQHPGAVGRPYPTVEVALVDPETGLALEGEATGELWVRGPSVFAEYLGDPEATARAKTGNWLRTGDLFSRDARGVYRIVDRIKDIFVSGGENVAPAEVERALLRHPLLTSAAVVGVPDPVWGERGVAFVTACAPVSEDEILSHVRTRLAAFKLPVRVLIVDELPRATIEKVARRRLRELALRLVTTAPEEARDVHRR